MAQWLARQICRPAAKIFEVQCQTGVTFIHEGCKFSCFFFFDQIQISRNNYNDSPMWNQTLLLKRADHKF